MPFERINFARQAVGGSAHAPMIFTYRSDDGMNDIRGSGYFNSVRNELREGDVIFIVSTAAAAPALDSVTVNKPDDRTQNITVVRRS